MRVRTQSFIFSIRKKIMRLKGLSTVLYLSHTTSRISLLLHQSEAELRQLLITKICYECGGV